MSRALVSERLAVAAVEVEYEERLRLSKEKLGRRQLRVVLHRVDEQLPVSVLQSGGDCAHRVRFSLPERPEHREEEEDVSSDTELAEIPQRDSDIDKWQRPLSCSPERMETDEDHDETMQLCSMREDTGPKV